MSESASCCIAGSNISSVLPVIDERLFPKDSGDASVIISCKRLEADVISGCADANNAENSITMLADPYLSFTKSIGAEVDRNSRGMGIRSSRYAIIIENLEVQNIQEEKETKSCGISSAESILEII